MATGLAEVWPLCSDQLQGKTERVSVSDNPHLWNSNFWFDQSRVNSRQPHGTSITFTVYGASWLNALPA